MSTFTERHPGLPDADRLSALTAMLILAYALTRFVEFPERVFSLQLPGLYLSFEFSVRTVTGLLAAGLTASGADWLLRDHPALQGRSTLGHWILPSLTALVIGVPLNQVGYGPVWWLALGAGSAVMVLVLVAEYIAVDGEDVRQPLAAAALSAVSLALFLVLASALRASGARLVVELPVLALAAWLVSLRLLHLRLNGEWTIYEAAIIALVVGQFTAALHYWPLSPVSFGLAILGPIYALVSLVNGMIEEKPLRSLITEPGLALLISWLAALWMR